MIKGVFKAVKIMVFTKRKIIQCAIIAVAIALIVLFAVFFIRPSLPTFQFKSKAEWPEIEVYELNVEAGERRELPIYDVGREDNKIALTIDAAWEDMRTAELINLLDQEGIKATFFLCRYWVENCPDSVKLIAERGHEIGNHSATHPHMSKLSAAEIQKELNDMDDSLEKLTGKRSTLFRPPYGEYDNNVIRTARANNYEVIQWSVDTIDWQNERSVQEIVDRVLNNTGSGDIILCHNNAQHVLEYMPVIIKELKSRGYEFVTVSEILLSGETTIDSNGTMQATIGEA